MVHSPRTVCARNGERVIRSPARPLLAVLIVMLFAVPAAPVAADGMPSYTLGQGDAEEVFGSLFESRQLARVDLLNDTHERIALFLSVYSLDPGTNLTLMVPLRTLPVSVTGSPVKESVFRKDQLLDRAEEEVGRQDPTAAWSVLGDEVTDAIEGCFGSMLFTLPGEYIRENFHIVQEDSEGRDALGGGGEAILGPGVEPVQHYEFDGFSVDVFGVDAGPRLAEYLLEKGLVLPEQGDLERYNTHYLAVVEGASKPPIDATDFAFLQENTPNTAAMVVQALRADPVRTRGQISDLKNNMEYTLRSEWEQGYTDIYSNETVYRAYRHSYDILDELIDAVFGPTDFAGEVLRIELPLDSGKMFFPLGTSVGWPNEVGDIDILFRVPEDRDLSLPMTKDAYFDGSHWYLFQLSSANPAFDLDSKTGTGSDSHRKAAARAAFITDNGAALAGLLVALLAILVWFAAAFLAKSHWGLEGGTVRDPRMWLMLGMAIVLSIPGAVLAYLLVWPLPFKELNARVMPLAQLAVLPAACVLLLVGVLL